MEKITIPIENVFLVMFFIFDEKKSFFKKDLNDVESQSA